MPESMISKLLTPEDLLSFFQREFPDSLPLIGEKKLVADFFRNPKSPLMSIKVLHLHTMLTSAHHTTTKIKR